MPTRWRAADLFLVALVATVSIWFAWAALPSLARVNEDAATLLRYDQNLSQSGVVAYSQGEGPTDGATAVVFAAVLPALTNPTPTRDVLPAYALLAIITAALTGAELCFSARVHQRGTNLASFVGATFIGAGAQRVYISAKYDTSFNSLLALAAFVACTQAWLTDSPCLRMPAFFPIAVVFGAQPDCIVSIAGLLVFMFWSMNDPLRLRKAATYALAALVTLSSVGALRLLSLWHAIPLAWLRKGGELLLARLSSVSLHFLELAFLLLVVLALAMASLRHRSASMRPPCHLCLLASLGRWFQNRRTCSAAFSTPCFLSSRAACADSLEVIGQRSRRRLFTGVHLYALYTFCWGIFLSTIETSPTRSRRLPIVLRPSLVGVGN